MTTQNPPPDAPKQIVSGELFYVDGKPYIFTQASISTERPTDHGHVVHCVEYM